MGDGRRYRIRPSPTRFSNTKPGTGQQGLICIRVDILISNMSIFEVKPNSRYAGGIKWIQGQTAGTDGVRVTSRGKGDTGWVQGGGHPCQAAEVGAELVDGRHVLPAGRGPTAHRLVLIWYQSTKSGFIRMVQIAHGMADTSKVPARRRPCASHPPPPPAPAPLPLLPLLPLRRPPPPPRGRQTAWSRSAAGKTHFSVDLRRPCRLPCRLPYPRPRPPCAARGPRRQGRA